MPLIVIGSIRYLSCSSAAYADTVHWRHKGLEVPIIFCTYNFAVCMMIPNTYIALDLASALALTLTLALALALSQAYIARR